MKLRFRICCRYIAYSETFHARIKNIYASKIISLEIENILIIVWIYWIIKLKIELKLNDTIFMHSNTSKTERKYEQPPHCTKTMSLLQQIEQNQLKLVFRFNVIEAECIHTWVYFAEAKNIENSNWNNSEENIRYIWEKRRCGRLRI